MGFNKQDYECPGCAETIDPAGQSQCPLCETPIIKTSSSQQNTVLCRACKSSAPLDASTCPQCGRTLASGGIWFLIPAFLLFAIAVMGILAAIALPNFKKARDRANKRACFANQKTIAGAMEMYNLDYNLNVQNLDLSVLQTLQQQGYLQSIPYCPVYKRENRNSYEKSQAYSLTASGDVTCTKHGSILNRKYEVEK